MIENISITAIFVFEEARLKKKNRGNVLQKKGETFPLKKGAICNLVHVTLTTFIIAI